MATNLERMLQLVGEFFDTRSDPDQLDVTEKDREKLAALHPATMSEYATEDGPVAWILIIPTTTEIMQRFVNAEIGEKQLLHETPTGGSYEAVYLCSAAVLPEYRRQGVALKLSMDAINAMRKDHPVKALFTWSFSQEGRDLAEAIARKCNLPLYERKHKEQ